MMVGPHTEIVGYPLTDALGVVIVDLACQRAESLQSQWHSSPPIRNVHFAAAAQHMLRRAGQPVWKMVAAHDVINDDFERPRSGEAHRRLREHADEYDCESPTVGAYEVTDQADHPSHPSVRNRTLSISPVPLTPICASSMDGPSVAPVVRSLPWSFVGDDATVVGLHAPTANSKMVNLDIATADWRRQL